ncbi:hypothetical protein Pan44_38000 [Caulifigura coniformis]|uniref:Uncharacterized protein n=1 Tax=Caulifigura coniformis TaxID=2527983 RepID=A0A517SI06_9PLAN|nr:MGMT family protein [Caulifigura coniformis]QDT55753.1 hypothetical protein Pan44_38000 [Caulifigura coniformis]
MLKTRRSWREKLADSKDLPRTIVLEGRAREKWGGGTMVIPAPLQVDALMRKAPAGKVVTSAELRAALARDAGVESACPITTGIFAWIAANAADEAEKEGQSRVTPWWRTLKTGGELNAKFPGGLAEQARRLESEGHRIIERGKRRFVAEHTAVLAEL